MRNQGQMLFGILIILVGLMFLLGSVFDVDVGDLCFPAGLILLGIWILFRPRLVGPDTALWLRVFGPIRRRGAWQVADEEIWLFVGDVRLDMTQAEIPLGETRIRVFGFVGNVRLVVPEGVGVSVSSMAFVTDARVLGQRRDGFLVPVHLTSDDYETAVRKVHLETMSFVADVRVKLV
ncbi:MAG: cell wall-active antibiotics response protein LiaF [Anaerolineae bacterium]